MIKEHTRITEFKLESVELDCNNIIPLEHEVQRVQLSQDKKTIKVFYSTGDIHKIFPVVNPKGLEIEEDD